VWLSLIFKEELSKQLVLLLLLLFFFFFFLFLSLFFFFFVFKANGSHHFPGSAVAFKATIGIIGNVARNIFW
jgi:hypothetical protein